MGLITGKHEICKQIADSLGIKHCKRLSINFVYNELVKVTAEFYPEIDGVKQFPAILKEFNLVEKKEQDNGQNNKTD